MLLNQTIFNMKFVKKELMTVDIKIKLNCLKQVYGAVIGIFVLNHQVMEILM